MGLLDIFNPLAAISGSLGSLASGMHSNELLNNYYGGHNWATVPENQGGGNSFDWSQAFAADPNSQNNPFLQTMLSKNAQHLPQFGLAYQGAVANQQALQRQMPYADQAIQGVQNSAEGAANTDLQARIKSGQPAITQVDVDQMVAQLVDQNNAAAAAQRGNAQESLARSGAGPGQTAALAQQADIANSQANTQAQRDVQLKAAMFNPQYALALDQAGAQVGGDYSSRLAQALYARGGLEQPFDFTGLANFGAAQGQAGVNALAGLAQSQGNQFNAAGQGGFQNWASIHNANQIAANQPNPWAQLFGGAAAGGAALGLGQGGVNLANLIIP